MNSEVENSDLIRQYLLGVLAEEQSEQLEEKLLTSGDLREELQIVEDELIDEYLCGELSEKDHKQFATHFLQAPERRQNLHFSKALEHYVAVADDAVTEESEAADVPSLSNSSFLPSFFKIKNSALSWSLAIVLLLAVLAGIWAIIRLPRNNQTSPHIVRLEPGRVREGGEISKIALPANVSTVELHLVIPANDYTRYRAVLQSGDVTEVWTGDAGAPATAESENYIKLNIPARILRPDDYRLTLSGYASDDRSEVFTHYSFRVMP